MARALGSPAPDGPVTIDGRGDEKAWSSASWTDDFFDRWDHAHTKAAGVLETKAAVLSDSDNLYLLFRCKEPNTGKMVAHEDTTWPVYEDDSLEIMLFPPSEGNNYFQVCVNSKGRLELLEHPGGHRDPADFGIIAATSVDADSYTVELKVPVEKIFPLVRGDVWRVLFCRNRMVTDELTPRHGIAKNCCWTLDCGTHHRPADYRPMRIGEQGASAAWRVGIVDACATNGVPVGKAYLAFVKAAGAEPVVLHATEDKAEGMAAFVEKRAGVWKGR